MIHLQRWMTVALVTLLLAGCTPVSRSVQSTAPNDGRGSPTQPVTNQPKPTVPAPLEIKPLEPFSRPIISDKRMFFLGWTKPDNSDRAIYMRDVQTGTESQIVLSTAEEVVGFPKATGDWVVVGLFPQTSKLPSAWRLVAKNLQTGKTRELATAAVGGMQLQFSVDDNRVVWLESDWSDQFKSWSRLKMHDLSTGVTKTLVETHYPEDIESVSLSQGKVVYTRFATTGSDAEGHPKFSSDVHLLDLATNEDRTLSSTHDTWQAQIYGNFVVWKRGINLAAYGDLVLLSLETGKAQTIVQNDDHTGISDPEIGEGFVSWREYLGKRRIPVYLINEGQVVELDQGEVGAPIASGKYLTWAWLPKPDDARIRVWSLTGSPPQ